MKPAEPHSALTARGLARRFGDRDVLRGIDFRVEPGEVVALIGPNGAGKTTLLSILAGIDRPDAGRVTGHGVGWVPQRPALYRRLTVAENLSLFARLQLAAGRGSSTVTDRVARMLELTGLDSRRDDRVGTLSGGNQQRVNIAIGLMSDPAVLLLDEPGVGLDPAQKARLWRFILELVESGAGVAFSTHDIQEAERYAARIVVLADGRSRFSGTAAELRLAVEESGGPAGPHPDLETSFLAFLDEVDAR